jgi:hypothetical protein
MGKRNKRKASTPIERAAAGESRGEVIDYPSSRRIRRAAKLFGTTSNLLAECRFASIGRVGACRGIYPLYYMTRFEQLVKGKRVIACVCEDCRCQLEAQRRGQLGKDDEPIDPSPAELLARDMELQDGFFVTAIVDFLAELEAHGQLARLR